VFGRELHSHDDSWRPTTRNLPDLSRGGQRGAVALWHPSSPSADVVKNPAADRPKLPGTMIGHARRQPPTEAKVKAPMHGVGLLAIGAARSGLQPAVTTPNSGCGQFASNLNPPVARGSERGPGGRPRLETNSTDAIAVERQGSLRADPDPGRTGRLFTAPSLA